MRLAQDLDIDLWTLDALLWVPLSEEGQPRPPGGIAAVVEAEPDSIDCEQPDEVIQAHRFALEAHLQRFLWANWDRTELDREWARYTSRETRRLGSSTSRMLAGRAPNPTQQVA